MLSDLSHFKWNAPAGKAGYRWEQRRVLRFGVPTVEWFLMLEENLRCRAYFPFKEESGLFFYFVHFELFSLPNIVCKTFWQVQDWILFHQDLCPWPLKKQKLPVMDLLLPTEKRWSWYWYPLYTFAELPDPGWKMRSVIKLVNVLLKCLLVIFSKALDEMFSKPV